MTKPTVLVKFVNFCAANNTNQIFIYIVNLFKSMNKFKIFKIKTKK